MARRQESVFDEISSIKENVSVIKNDIVWIKRIGFILVTAILIPVLLPLLTKMVIVFNDKGIKFWG